MKEALQGQICPMMILQGSIHGEINLVGKMRQTVILRGTLRELTIPDSQTKTMDLDMASGDQVVKPDSGKVLSQVTVKKPITFTAENIKKDVNIGGVVGTLTVPAIQPSKSLTITSNGTVSVTPDAPYDAFKKVDVTVDVVDGNLKAVIERTAPNPVLPDDLTSIGYSAFSGYTNLALTSLPSGITSMSDYAFNNCPKLALTSLPSGVTNIGSYAFQGCTNLALTSLPSGVTHIGYYAFSNCRKLALTRLPHGVTNIGYGVFNNCTGLTSITFEGNPKTIHSSAFNGCSNLTTINVPWAEGVVANAPWGATNATINYNYTEEV